MSVKQDNQNTNINVSDLECALSFERLSLKNLQCSSKEFEIQTTTTTTTTTTNVKNNLNKSVFKYGRFRPYYIPLYSRMRHFELKTKKKIITLLDCDNIKFDKTKLIGCNFTDSKLPLFPLLKRKITSSPKPCWLQHEQTVSYANSNNVNSKSNVNSSLPSPSLSDSELSFEVDELSEYFQQFVYVKLKMSMQAESMYA